MRRLTVFFLAVLLVSSLACATAFSPRAIRDEIARQTGSPPPDAFEVTIGEVTMTLAKALAAQATEGELPLQGLDRLELAVYPVPAGKAGSLDFTQMAVRGWEPVVKVKKGPNSGFVLVRSEGGDTIGDLVVVAAGSEQVVYGRLKGRLPKALPQALGEVVKEGGPSVLRQRLLDATTAGGDGEGN